jgi:hypothetical protein
LRREGRRKRKAGAKNEKAIMIIAASPKRSTKKAEFQKFLVQKILLTSTATPGGSGLRP